MQDMPLPPGRSLLARLSVGLAGLIALSLLGVVVVALGNTGNGSLGLLGVAVIAALPLAPAAWLLWKAGSAPRRGWSATLYAAGAIPLAGIAFLVVGLALGDTVGDASGLETLAARAATIGLAVVAGGTLVATALAFFQRSPTVG